jgi:hypothetical protein
VSGCGNPKDTPPFLSCQSTTFDYISEILIEDGVMERVDAMLAQVSADAELEVLRFAA